MSPWGGLGGPPQDMAPATGGGRRNFADLGLNLTEPLQEGKDDPKTVFKMAREGHEPPTERSRRRAWAVTCAYGGRACRTGRSGSRHALGFAFS